MQSSHVRRVALLAALPLLFVTTGHRAPDPARVVSQITGRITTDNGDPLAAVQIYIAGSGIGALSQQNGRYLLLNVPVGTHTVTAERIGFATMTRQVTVTEGQTVVQDFVLTPEALGLDEIIVSGAPSGSQRRAIGNSVASRPDETRVEREAGPTISGAAPPPPVEPGRYAQPDQPGHFPQPGTDRESYAHIDENGFRVARRSPLSTFAIDVDRASYANVRRFITNGARPPVDAVRIEELINYFPYGYAEPRGEHPFAVHTEVAFAPWERSHLLVRVGIQGKRMHTEEMPPANFTFLVDVSGSMDSPDKLPLVKSALRMLVHELMADDRVALVVYAGAAGLVLPPTSGRDKEEILNAIDHLEAGGSTAGGEGLRLAYDVARRSHRRGGNNRVILATDGDFNVGASSDAEMVRLIEERRDQGTFLSVLGFGTGNLQDSKMEQIADHGNGNYAYIDGMAEARKVLIHEMGGTLLTIAKDVKIQVEFNPAQVASYRLIGYENRLMAAEDFVDDSKDGGELGAGHSVTALYEVVPVDARRGTNGRELDALRYQRPAQTRSGTEGELLFVQLRYKTPQGTESRLIRHPVPDRIGDFSADFRFAAAVAGFGMVLRDSPHRGEFGLDQVISLAKGSVGDDRDGYRRDFIELVERTRSMELVASRRW
jgi:Ca-activated chloride channel family protein